MIEINNPKHFPRLFILLKDDWENALKRLEREGVKLGSVYIYRKPLRKSEWKIIGVEVLQ